MRLGWWWNLLLFCVDLWLVGRLPSLYCAKKRMARYRKYTVGCLAGQTRGMLWPERQRRDETKRIRKLNIDPQFREQDSIRTFLPRNTTMSKWGARAAQKRTTAQKSRPASRIVRLIAKCWIEFVIVLNCVNLTIFWASGEVVGVWNTPPPIPKTETQSRAGGGLL